MSDLNNCQNLKVWHLSVKKYYAYNGALHKGLISLPISFIIWVQINKHLQLFVVRFFWIEIRPLQVLRPWSNFLIFKCPQRFQAQIRDNSKLSHFCLVHLPRKIFLSWTILKLSWTKKFSRVKNSIFCFQKLFKMKFSDWKTF